MTPRKVDLDGLSFSVFPGPKSGVTTVKALNATGIVHAYCTSPTHVVVVPVDATVKDWYEAGPESRWTQAVMSVVVKWEGE